MRSSTNLLVRANMVFSEREKSLSGMFVAASKETTCGGDDSFKSISPPLSLCLHESSKIFTINCSKYSKIIIPLKNNSFYRNPFFEIYLYNHILYYIIHVTLSC